MTPALRKPFFFFAALFLFTLFFSTLFWPSAKAQPTEYILTSEFPMEMDSFGFSTAISEDWAVIGDPLFPELAPYTGGVLVYKKEGGNWVFDSKFLPAANDLNNRLGISVSLSGSRFAVSSFDGEIVYVYELQGSTWGESAQIIPPTPPISGFQNLALSGDWLIIASASLYFYKYETGTWTLKQTLSGGQDYLDISSNRAIAGPYIFELENGTWNQVAFFPGYGQNAAIDGDWAIIGKQLFQRQAGAWQPAQTLNVPEFAARTAISGNRLVLGTFPQKVYVFENRSGTWTQIAELQSDDVNGAGFGEYGLDISGELVIVGDIPDFDTINFGRAFIYDFTFYIPTMGQWAFWLFGLGVFTIAVIGLYNLKQAKDSY